MNPFSLQLQFGLIQVRIEWEGSALAEPIRHPYRYSSFYRPQTENPDLLIKIHCGGSLPSRPDGCDLLFHAEEAWSVYRDKERYLFEGVETPGASDPYVTWRGWAGKELTCVDFFVLPERGLQAPPIWYLSRLMHPLHLLLSARLPLMGGLFLHALGIAYQGEGLLLLGGDGAGKSTLAGLWNKRGTGAVLNDDRLILQKEKGEWVLFSTPWHGDFQKISPTAVSLKRLYTISHASSNRLETLPKKEAVKTLMRQLFLAFWHREVIENALTLCAELAEGFPMRSFGFIKDPSAVDSLLGSFNSAPDFRPVSPAEAPT